MKRNSLESVRKELDEVDKTLVGLLDQRAGLSLKVAKIKREAKEGGAIYHPQRENQIVENLKELCHQRGYENLPTSHLSPIYREIFSSSRALQRETNIAYLGPKGTFSYFASKKLFGEQAKFTPHDNFPSLFSAIESQACSYGVVPLENSLYGGVVGTLDLFYYHNLSIIEELYFPIQHGLLSRETDLSEIHILYSHPQALGQCQKWIQKNLPHVELRSSVSTAQGVIDSLSHPHSAAIGHPSLCEEGEISLLDSNIADSTKNTTRFVVLAKKPTGEGTHSALLFSIPNKTGSLIKILDIFSSQKINLCKLESRPLPDSSWEYLFFVDVEVNLYAQEYEEVLKLIQDVTGFFRLLGTFTRALS